MKKLIILCLLAFSFSVSAQTIRRVNNNLGVTLSLNMYSSLQAAHDAAVAGDIIYVEPSITNYGSLICTKTLQIIGNGYASTFSNSPAEIANKQKTSIGTVTIRRTAPNTKLIGMETYQITVEALNVTIDRCYLGTYSIELYRKATGENASGTIISRCYYPIINFHGYTVNPVSPSCTYVANQVENVQILNTVIYSAIGGDALIRGGVCNGNAATGVPSAKNLSLINNIIPVSFQLVVYGENTTVYSNICKNITPNGQTGTSFVSSNNVCTGLCGYGTNNVENEPWNALFSTPSPSNDHDFILPGTSLAKGAGIAGTDAGIYGGANPYSVGGLAPIPQITSYSKNASSGVYTTSTPMTVTVSVRGNN